MLALTAVLVRVAGPSALTAALVCTVALMSSFGPVIALANLGTGLQNTFAAGNRVLDILDEQPAVKEVDRRQGHCVQWCRRPPRDLRLR